MRNVVLGVGITLDGYIARLDGGVDFLFMPKDYSMAPFFSTIDTAVAGHKTHDAAMKMSGGSFASEMPTYIFSRSQPPGKRDGVEFVNESPAALIARLRRSRGKDIWMMGGGELARDFLEADLIDGIYLGVGRFIIYRSLPAPGPSRGASPVRPPPNRIRAQARH